MENYVEFKEVKKKYKMGEVEIEALAGVDFSVKKGEFVVVAGASGAGKSTILNILGGMDTVSSGTVTVDGNVISTYSQKELVTYRRFDIGFVFQFYNLVQNLTAKENVELATQISKNPLNVDEVLDSVGLSHRKNNFPAQLSGGEQQRVAIARALALNPKILLCDEATSALDPKTTKSILSLLREINEKLDITIIIVTHQMEVVKEICERVAIMEDGQVLAVGNTEDLFLKNPKALKTLIGEDEILPLEGINIKLYFPKDNSNDSIITAMARELNIDFSIVWGKLERFREDVLGSLVINIKKEQINEVSKYLDSKNMDWEVI